MDEHASKRRSTSGRRADPIGATALVLIATALAPASWAQQQPPCEADALEEWSCAKEIRGSAVIDNLGRVVCAPGACVETDDEWVCSTVPGGAAGLKADGPVCDGECRPPSIQDCEKL